MNEPTTVATAEAKPNCAPVPGSVTVAYSIVNDNEWGATNPLRYEHNGLKAHTVAVFNAFERIDRYREELERLRDIVCPSDVENIDAVLSESQNSKLKHAGQGGVDCK